MSSTQSDSIYRVLFSSSGKLATPDAEKQDTRELRFASKFKDFLVRMEKEFVMTFAARAKLRDPYGLVEEKEISRWSKATDFNIENVGNANYDLLEFALNATAGSGQLTRPIQANVDAYLKDPKKDDRAKNALRKVVETFMLGDHAKENPLVSGSKEQESDDEEEKYEDESEPAKSSGSGQGTQGGDSSSSADSSSSSSALIPKKGATASSASDDDSDEDKRTRKRFDDAGERVVSDASAIAVLKSFKPLGKEMPQLPATFGMADMRRTTLKAILNLTDSTLDADSKADVDAEVFKTISANVRDVQSIDSVGKSSSGVSAHFGNDDIKTMETSAFVTLVERAVKKATGATIELSQLCSYGMQIIMHSTCAKDRAMGLLDLVNWRKIEEEIKETKASDRVRSLLDRTLFPLFMPLICQFQTMGSAEAWSYEKEHVGNAIMRDDISETVEIKAVKHCLSYTDLARGMRMILQIFGGNVTVADFYNFAAHIYTNGTNQKIADDHPVGRFTHGNIKGLMNRTEAIGKNMLVRILCGFMQEIHQKPSDWKEIRGISNRFELSMIDAQLSESDDYKLLVAKKYNFFGGQLVSGVPADVKMAHTRISLKLFAARKSQVSTGNK